MSYDRSRIVARRSRKTYSNNSLNFYVFMFSNVCKIGHFIFMFDLQSVVTDEPVEAYSLPYNYPIRIDSRINTIIPHIT